MCEFQHCQTCKLNSIEPFDFTQNTILQCVFRLHLRTSNVKFSSSIVFNFNVLCVCLSLQSFLLSFLDILHGLFRSEKEKEKQEAAGMHADVDRDDQIGETSQSTGNLTKRTSRFIPDMQKQASRISVKSVASDADSDTGNNLQIVDETKKSSRCRTPFIFEVVKLNSPEWYYLLLGGIASLAFGGVTPVCKYF